MADANNFTVLLGDKPLNLAPPISYRRDIKTERVEWNPAEFDPTYQGPVIEKDMVVSDCYQIFSGTRLVAVSNGGWSLTRDDKTGHMTLRLSEEATVLY
jgi:hypothetical protein